MIELGVFGNPTKVIYTCNEGFSVTGTGTGKNVAPLEYLMLFLTFFLILFYTLFIINVNGVS